MTTYHLHRSGVLRGLTNENPPYCDPTKKNALPTARGDCGNSISRQLFNNKFSYYGQHFHSGHFGEFRFGKRRS